MIEPGDLTGVPNDLAVRLLATAASIAPCLQSLEDANKTTAIALLKAIAADAAPRGSRFIKSERMGPAAVEYFEVDSWFSDDDRSALRALCSGTDTASNGPVGEFPHASQVVHRLWPNE